MVIRTFIAGIIQGSEQGLGVHDQSYRDAIRRILESRLPAIDIYCPVQNHPQSVSYDDLQARKVFSAHLEKIRASHILIVYLPQASMGSSIEMWEAYKSQRLILTISPMVKNWVVRLFSDEIFEDMNAFRDYVMSGDLERLLKHRYSTHFHSI